MRSYPRADGSSLNARGYRNVVFATHLGCHPHHIALAKADRFLLTSPADQFNANNAANETENNFSSPPSAQLSVNLNLLRDARGHWAIINCILCGLLCALAGGGVRGASIGRKHSEIQEFISVEGPNHSDLVDSFSVNKLLSYNRVFEWATSINLIFSRIRKNLNVKCKQNLHRRKRHGYFDSTALNWSFVHNYSWPTQLKITIKLTKLQSSSHSLPCGCFNMYIRYSPLSLVEIINKTRWDIRRRPLIRTNKTIRRWEVRESFSSSRSAACCRRSNSYNKYTGRRPPHMMMRDNATRAFELPLDRYIVNCFLSTVSQPLSGIVLIAAVRAI